MIAAATRTLILGAAILTAAGAPALPATDEVVAEPQGYWQGPMNAKVPATLAGGLVIGTEDLARLIRDESPVLIDVMPAQRKPPQPSTPWLPVPHKDIPGSIWIPGAGSGVISAAMASYFHDRLAELTNHNFDKPVVFYCRPDCWASWNAAKRAIADGYRRVCWYPGGVEAWQEAGLATEVASAEGPAVQ
ncbi:MAG: rhodanese-like domain-containing protein [Pseudomonadota bacterium]